MLNMCDAGALLMLNTFFDRAGFSIELFVDVNPLLDNEAGTSRTLAAGPLVSGTMTQSLDSVAVAAGFLNTIPAMEWEDITWTFDGPLTNTGGLTTIKGYSILYGTTFIFEELLPGGGFTPVRSGDTLVIAPQFKLGNVDEVAAITEA